MQNLKLPPEHEETMKKSFSELKKIMDDQNSSHNWPQKNDYIMHQLCSLAKDGCWLVYPILRDIFLNGKYGQEKNGILCNIFAGYFRSIKSFDELRAAQIRGKARLEWYAVARAQQEANANAKAQEESQDIKPRHSDTSHETSDSDESQTGTMTTNPLIQNELRQRKK